MTVSEEFEAMMALYAFDGTWNSGKTDDDQSLTNTNVVRFFQAYHKNSSANDFYVAGVGTRLNELGKIVGGVFGMGELPRLDEAYDRLCQGWADNDHTIDVVGFSRGAATTLDFCHIIQDRGIRRVGSDEVVEANPKIRFLGVWDVVAAFGLASLGDEALNIGHHLSIPSSQLQYCCHALALDERRPSFLPTRLHGADEVWFRGVHSDIGGGNGNRGLNDITLKWMMSKAQAAGLPITNADIAALNPVPGTAPHADHVLPLKIRAISAIDRRHYTVSPMGDWTTPPSTCPVEAEADEQRVTEVGAQPIEVLPRDARLRFDALWETAEAAAKSREFEIDEATDALGSLFQGRVVLITNDDQLKQAGDAVVQLLNAMMDEAHERGFHILHEVDLNEALFNLQPLFPFTN